MAKTDRCVVRNQAYRRGEFNIRERHNERKNISYGNGDIVPERSGFNINFKQCAGTYEQEFSRMVESGEISLRGLKADAKVFDELVFDVNSAYFENHGGYDYAKAFFAEAYKLASKKLVASNTFYRLYFTQTSATKPCRISLAGMCSITICMLCMCLSLTRKSNGQSGAKTRLWWERSKRL